MTNPTTADYLKYANLQMAAEAFIRDPESGRLSASGIELRDALVEGNSHASRFTKSEAEKFATHWAVVDQKANTTTGFSGTLFKCIKDDPATGAKKDELVLSFRSTEFIDDSARDNLATNTYEIKETGWAWGQIADMEKWYAELRAAPAKLKGQGILRHRLQPWRAPTVGAVAANSQRVSVGAWLWADLWVGRPPQVFRTRLLPASCWRAV